jgi:error-prone DNA polymerase
LIVWSDRYERSRRTIRLSRCLLVEGVVQREGEVVHILAERFRGLDEELPGLGSLSRDFH